MAGFGRFKLTDALPDQAPADQEAAFWRRTCPAPRRARRRRAKARRRASSRVTRASCRNPPGADAEPGIRDRMVDIGRGNQQAGRQRTSGK